MRVCVCTLHHVELVYAAELFTIVYDTMARADVDINNPFFFLLSLLYIFLYTMTTTATSLFLGW